eukprot:COSAG02_NODE_5487_length_4287_cov_40.035112_2_plen_88_part_00
MNAESECGPDLWYGEVRTGNVYSIKFVQCHMYNLGTAPNVQNCPGFARCTVPALTAQTLRQRGGRRRADPGRRAVVGHTGNGDEINM